MKQRMITVIFGIALLLIILLFYNTTVLNIAIAVFSVIAVYEIFAATKSKGEIPSIVCYLYAAVFPFLNVYKCKDFAFAIYFTFVFVLFVIMLYKHKTLSIEKMSLCYFMTILTTASLSCIVYIRDEYAGNQLKDLAFFYLALIFLGAWMTDGGGYIFGKLYGKHKLSPTVSPKKTIEGAVGGILITVLASICALWGYSAYLSNVGVQAHYNYVSIILLALLSAAVSIIGDLSASLIKREYKIKDFGKLLPGHGGVLDRFDSILFVAPLTVAWLRLFPVVTL